MLFKTTMGFDGRSRTDQWQFDTWKQHANLFIVFLSFSSQPMWKTLFVPLIEFGQDILNGGASFVASDMLSDTIIYAKWPHRNAHKISKWLDDINKSEDWQREWMSVTIAFSQSTLSMSFEISSHWILSKIYECSWLKLRFSLHCPNHFSIL